MSGSASQSSALTALLFRARLSTLATSAAVGLMPSGLAATHTSSTCRLDLVLCGRGPHARLPTAVTHPSPEAEDGVVGVAPSPAVPKLIIRGLAVLGPLACRTHLPLEVVEVEVLAELILEPLS